MDEMQAKVNEWEQQLRRVKLPKWNELPNFLLYMDQLTSLVNGVLSPLEVDEVTPSMINNYVKKKALMAPVKKKYQTMQVADLILITLLKPVYSLETIRYGIDQVTASIFPQQAYDSFVARFNYSIGKIDNYHFDYLPVNDINDRMLQVAVNLIIDRLQSQKILNVIAKPLPKIGK